MAGRLDGDCVRPADVTDNLGRLCQTNVVNEAGLYEVIIRSDKPEAVQFRRWVTSEVLPSIRNGQGKITPMQDAVNRGILILTERIDHTGKIRPQLLVTPAGQSYFAGILSA